LEDLENVGRISKPSPNYRLSGEVVNFREVYLLEPFSGGSPIEVYFGGNFAIDDDTHAFSIEMGTKTIVCSGTGSTCRVEKTKDGGVKIILL
jgi:hypothetical protein